VVIQERVAEAPQAANKLGAPIERLVVRDSSGKFFAARNLGEGESVALAPVAWSDMAREFQEKLAAVRPSNPEGYNPREHNEVLNFGNRGFWWGGDVDSGLAEPTLSSSILERSLRRVTSTAPDALAPRSYIALVPRSPEAPLGIDEVKQMQSLHVVVGKW
jgi:hypothetical protein